MSFDPFSFGGLAALNIFSGFQESQAIESQARIQEAINDVNTEFAEVDAFNAEKEGFTQAAKYQSTIDQTVGGQRAAFAGQNIDITSGSAAQIQEDTRVAGMLNAQAIKSIARQKALGFKNEAANIRMSSTMQRAQASINASAARTRGFVNAAGVGLSYLARNPTASFRLPTLDDASKVGDFFRNANNLGDVGSVERAVNVGRRSGNSSSGFGGL